MLVCGLLVLAGCTTSQRPGNVNHVPDWETAEYAEVPAAVPLEFAPAQPPAPPNIPSPVVTPVPTNRFPETWVSFNRWSQSNGFGGLQRISTAATPTYSLTTPNGTLVIRVGNLSAYWDGLEFRLGFALQLIDNRPYVHTLDVQKNILPLVSGPTEFAKTNRIIVIDPGHGGEDAGTKNVFNGRYEKEFTLDWARRLEPLLTTNGWQVFLTRTNDRDVSLTNRVAFARQHSGDFFLSLHFNSSGGGSDPAGLETYCLTPAGMASSVTRGYYDDVRQIFPNNAFDAQNLQYAMRLQRALLEVNGTTGRGVRRARYPAVLRGQNRPAVLLEGGYLSNPREAKLIADPSYRQKLAEAVAKALTAGSETGNQKFQSGSPVNNPVTSSSDLPAREIKHEQ